MAFTNKIRSLFKKVVLSNPSIYQAVRLMSSSKLFIRGLSYSIDDQSLREAFFGYGEVVNARVITDRGFGRSRGFGFISFASGEEASAAMTALNGKEFHGQIVRVNIATEHRAGYGGGGGFGGGEYGGGGGYDGGSGYGGGGYSADDRGYGSGGYGDDVGDDFGSGGASGGFSGGSGDGKYNYNQSGRNNEDDFDDGDDDDSNKRN